MLTFSDYANQITQNVEINFHPIKEVDAIEFITSSEFMGESLFPVQSLIIKTFYSLWEIYPPTEEELMLLKFLETEWQIKIDISIPRDITYLILVLGRRSTKSTTISLIATYEIYSLICKDNPQAFYGIRERHPIHIMHVAAAGSQAEDVFRLSYNNIRRVKFFEKYIDFDKDSSTELRLFSPYDLRKNDEIRLRNAQVPRGMGRQKESLLSGSLTLESITTSAATSRGKSIKVLMLSEFAHFPRGSTGGGDVETLITTENLRTDYAIWKALTPSVRDFGKDGKVLVESSPREKGGEFYHHYCIAGGCEQDKFGEIVPDSEYQVIQLSTWQANPNFTKESLDNEFRKDPVGAAMEWGAHFGNPAGSFIPEEWIERVPQPMVTILTSNPHLWKFVITLDPGGKAKKKKADTYAMAWGHVEGYVGGDYIKEGENILYWVDGMKGWDSKIIPQGNGKYIQEPVDPNIVLDFIVQLVNDLGKNFIIEICYDQFESSSPIATLQGMGLPAVETTFTNSYKSVMYGNYLSKLTTNQVRMYGVDTDGWISRWKLEMKNLQRITQGNYTFYEHPKSGPVQHDDFTDVVSNLVHRLCLITTPTKKSIEQSRRQGTYPIQIKRGPAPLKGPGFGVKKVTLFG